MPQSSVARPRTKSNPRRPARDQLSFVFREGDETPAIETDAERWLILPDWPAYRLSTFGRIESRLERKGRPRDERRILGERWRELKPHLNHADGHLRVVLHNDGDRKECRLDSLVLTTFGRPCPPGMKCLHAPDPDHQNCRISNLDWGIPPTRHAQTKPCSQCGRLFARGPKAKKEWDATNCCSQACAAKAREERWDSRCPDESTLRRLYVDKRLTIDQIANIYGMSTCAVRGWMRRRDIAVRPPGMGLLNRGIEPPDGETLRRLIYDEFKTYEDIGAIYGVDFTAVPYWLDKLGITRPPGWHAKRKGIALVVPDADTLRSLYADGHSLRQIGEMYGIYDNKMRQLCEQYGIERKPGGFNYNGGQYYVCQDGREVRSSYEKRVADWLFSHSIAYEYEPPLPFGTNFLGDFLANGWYMEVWGVVGNETYEERKTRKIEGYASLALPLIELNHWHFGKRNAGTLEKRLRKCLVPPTQG